ncbi:UNVERIFIED_CONTAM: hypothetical protein Sradi_1500000 [Sesamum radiatum]|uniref:Uncharacterized protein n=1 Tax=Sesamum radiatum TaxID=300843 RepID=A0AAW2U8V0_SESRA
MSLPAKKTKASSDSFAQPTPKSSTRAGTPRPSSVQLKRENLSSNEPRSLLREEVIAAGLLTLRSDI